MNRYFLRSTVHANMNEGQENPQEPQENIPQADANNEPNIQTSDLLRELQVISHELQCNGSISKLENFSASQNSDVRAWITSVNKHNAILGLNEENKKRVLYATAAGPVSQFLTRFIRDNENATYNDLSRELIARFSTLNTHTANQTLKNIKQHKHENIQCFYERLQELADIAYKPDILRDRGTQDHLLNLFTDGLCDVRVKRHLIRNRPNNLEAALTSAIRETDILNELDARSKPKLSPNTETVTGVSVINNTQSDVSRSQPPPHAPRAQSRLRQNRRTDNYGGRPNMVQRNQFAPLPRCWICNASTHFMRNCPQNFQNRPRTNLHHPQRIMTHNQQRRPPPSQNYQPPRRPLN